MQSGALNIRKRYSIYNKFTKRSFRREESRCCFHLETGRSIFKTGKKIYASNYICERGICRNVNTYDHNKILGIYYRSSGSSEGRSWCTHLIVRTWHQVISIFSCLWRTRIMVKSWPQGRPVKIFLHLRKVYWRIFNNSSIFLKTMSCVSFQHRVCYIFSYAIIWVSTVILQCKVMAKSNESYQRTVRKLIEA